MANKTAVADTVRFYDANVSGKLEGFLEGNPRVECAWTTIKQWAPPEPTRVLEIGCGIGDVCWRMTRTWPRARVVGLDISPKSLELGKKLFSSSNLSFVEGHLTEGVLSGEFDLIVLMDVYEHIPAEDRSGLHQALRKSRMRGGRIFLSFPTPRHQAWLRQFAPAQIQPIDEDIEFKTIARLANDTDTDVMLYQEVNVWHQGDYAHAVLGTREGRFPVTAPPDHGIRGKLAKILNGREKTLVPSRRQRLALVRKHLGSECYPSKKL